jgi:hypothetical protein
VARGGGGVIAVVLQVPFTTNGAGQQVPDLGLTAPQLAQLEVVREDRVIHVFFHDDRAAVLKLLGTPAGQDPVFCGVMDPRVATFLAGLGTAKLDRLRTVWANRPTVKTWLLANGVSQDGGGRPIIPHVIAGGDAGIVDAIVTDSLWPV